MYIWNWFSVNSRGIIFGWDFPKVSTHRQNFTRLLFKLLSGDLIRFFSYVPIIPTTFYYGMVRYLYMIIDRILCDDVQDKINTDTRYLFQKNIRNKIKCFWSRMLYLWQRSTRRISYNCQDTTKWNGSVLSCALFIAIMFWLFLLYLYWFKSSSVQGISYSSLFKTIYV